MTPTQIRVCALIKDHIGIDVTCLSQTLDVTLIDGLKCDSLDLVELTMATEEEFGIEIADDEAEPFVSDDGTAGRTVRDWCALVEGKLGMAATAD